MTVIVGIAHQGDVYIGADSGGSASWTTTVRADTKAFLRGPFAFGFTTSFRMGQLLRYGLQVPPVPPEVDIDEFMATTFVDAVRTCLKDGGWAKKESEREEGGTFLVGIHGRLFRVCDDYQVGEALHGYDAVGCGEETALGALFATDGRDMDPTERIAIALRAAERHSAPIRQPFTIVLSPAETPDP